VADPGGLGPPAEAWLPAYLGLGSNLGDRCAYLAAAARRLATATAVRGLRLSPVYETDPVGLEDQPPFLNTVAALETALSPRELLELAGRVEDALGRVRSVRWGPRTIDVDILLVGNLRGAEADLTVPHPRMLERAFVLRPLADLAPSLVLPGRTSTVVGALGLLDQSGVRPYPLLEDWWRSAEADGVVPGAG
jgi:2-amino-4-hydroxy-6-hydroxymethyldihydropteridine diphosphokinase